MNTSKNIIKVMVADDHEMVRRGILDLLHNCSDIAVVEEARNGKQAIALAINSDIDVLLIDLNMPERNGIQVAEQVLAHKPSLPIIALTMHEEPAYIRAALQAGMMGYLLKSCTVKELQEAVRSVYNGKEYFSADVMRSAISFLMANGEHSKAAISDQFTEREREVLSLILKQKGNQEIAQELQISVKTVEAHKRNLLEKTDSKNVVGLILFASKSGFID